MKFEDIQDTIPEGAREDVVDTWVWAKSNPDQDIPAADAARWRTWLDEMEALQSRAAEVWAMIHELAPPLTSAALKAGAVEFPTWYGKWWVDVISYLPWDERLESAIILAEDWLEFKFTSGDIRDSLAQ